MGNGSGLKTGGKATFKLNGKTVAYADGVTFNVDTKPLSIQDIKNAAVAAANNFGKPSHIFMGTATMMTWGWEPNPELSPTEFAKHTRISKREKAFARLQVFLTKFGLQKHLEDPDARRADCEMATKRLKRASWARYQQRPKNKDNGTR